MSSENRRFSFRPSFEGALTVERIPNDWSDRMRRRLENGLVVPGNRSRAHYRVVSTSRDRLVFEAEDFLTAYAIGLNHVELSRDGADTIGYRVSFARWNRIAVAHGLLVGALLAGAAFVPQLRAQIGSYPFGSWIFWSMVAFFSLAWPWILTAIHRNAARETLEEILLDELDEAEPEARAAS